MRSSDKDKELRSGNGEASPSLCTGEKSVHNSIKTYASTRVGAVSVNTYLPWTTSSWYPEGRSGFLVPGYRCTYPSLNCAGNGASGEFGGDIYVVGGSKWGKS